MSPIKSIYLAFFCLLSSLAPALCSANDYAFSSYGWTADCFPFNLLMIIAQTSSIHFAIIDNLNTGTAKVGLYFFNTPTPIELEGHNSIPVSLSIPRHDSASNLAGAHDFAFQLKKVRNNRFEANVTYGQAYELMKALHDSGDNERDAMTLTALEWSDSTPLLGAKDSLDWLIKSQCGPKLTSW
jgi:hypothetical protein